MCRLVRIHSGVTWDHHHHRATKLNVNTKIGLVHTKCRSIDYLYLGEQVGKWMKHTHIDCHKTMVSMLVEQATNHFGIIWIRSLPSTMCLININHLCFSFLLFCWPSLSTFWRSVNIVVIPFWFSYILSVDIVFILFQNFPFSLFSVL